MYNDDFPYTQSFRKIPDFFKSIQSAAIPKKFTTSVLAEQFDLKGVNDRPLIGVLKNLGFVDDKGTPTNMYKEYRNPINSKNIIGECIKTCYADLYIKKYQLS